MEFKMKQEQIPDFESWKQSEEERLHFLGINVELNEFHYLRTYNPNFQEWEKRAIEKTPEEYLYSEKPLIDVEPTKINPITNPVYQRPSSPVIRLSPELKNAINNIVHGTR